MPDAAEVASGRYEIRQSEVGPFIYCKEAPSVAVRVDRSLAFSEADAQKLGERVILLDGVGQFAPTIDGRRQLYNLDHHADCLRSFTLASCEQALIVVAKGLTLDKGDWTIYANEPDLDTLLGIWILLNFRRVRTLNTEAKDRLFPMIRLEGAIDSNGAEIAEYCGLPSVELAVARGYVDFLFEKEKQIKQSGNWSQTDPLEFAVEMLQEIDAFVYGTEDLGEIAGVEHDYGHVDIGGGWVAVVCRDGSGIYEVERRLRHVWGDRLGLIVLERERAHYTVRRSASLSTIDLGVAYAMLNMLDRAVDGRPPEKRWGGSDEIGGSPRPSGSALSPDEVKETLRLAYHPPSTAEQVYTGIGAGLRTAFMVLGGSAAAAIAYVALPDALHPPGNLLLPLMFAWASALASTLLTARLSRGRAWLFGWRRPAGWDWWIPALGVPLTGLVTATWTPERVNPEVGSLLWLGITSASLALATELWFRGWLHGLFLPYGPIQLPRGRWFLSPANRWAGLIYAATVGAIAPIAFTGSMNWLDPSLALAVAAALAAGWLLGFVRERSLSVWPGVALQTLAIVVGILGHLARIR